MRQPSRTPSTLPESRLFVGFGRSGWPRGPPPTLPLSCPPGVRGPGGGQVWARHANPHWQSAMGSLSGAEAFALALFLALALALARAAIRPPALRATGTYLKICSFKVRSDEMLFTAFDRLAIVFLIHLAVAPYALLMYLSLHIVVLIFFQKICKNKILVWQKMFKYPPQSLAHVRWLRRVSNPPGVLFSSRSIGIEGAIGPQMVRSGQLLLANSAEPGIPLILQDGVNETGGCLLHLGHLLVDLLALLLDGCLWRHGGSVGRSFGRRELSARTYDSDELSENLRRHVAMQISDYI